MSDLLSASSLLLAILTTLFGTYYTAINEVLSLEPNNHKEDDKSNFEIATTVLKTKLIPLLLASISISLIFIPQSVKIILDSIKHYKELGGENLSYDTIATSYIAVTIFMIALTINILVIAKKFSLKMKAINPARD